MTFSFKKLAIAGLAAGLMTMSQGAQADSKDTAFDERNQIIKNTWGNCVRTKWMSDTDPCSPPAEPAPVVKQTPPPAPAPVISLGQRTVYFDFNKSTLNAAAKEKLNQLVAIVGRSKGILQANVIGYADKIGSDDYNVALSNKRASRVENYLKQYLNIPTQLLGVRGLGETNSVTDCESVKGRKAKIDCLSKDRRVEVEFKYKQ